MVSAHNISADVRRSLQRLAEIGDRTAPVVFAGRTDEFALLESAVRGVQRGENGRTVVIQGVPGVGKTALRDEFAARLLAHDANDGKAVIPVKLNASSLGFKPAAIVEQIDKAFRGLESSDWWERTVSRAADGAYFLGNALFAAATRKDVREFTAASRAPDSLGVVLDDYVGQRLGRRGSTIVLLVDEAQNLQDTPAVRTHLEELHNDGAGETPMMLACFGLATTVDRLADLGLSRLSRGHVRSIGALTNEEARQAVVGTLEEVLACHPFDEQDRSEWIDEAAIVILEDSGNFPHHLTNGCSALAQAVLLDGIGASPPADVVREKSRDYRQEYYEARLRPWSRYETALAYAFLESSDGQTPTNAIIAALTTVTDRGNPVSEEIAWDAVEGICRAGFMEERDRSINVLLPSLMKHFQDVRQRRSPNSQLIDAIRSELAVQD